MRVWNVLFVAISAVSGFATLGSAEGRNTRETSRRIPSSHRIHERREAGHVEGWVKREIPDGESVVPVRIALRQSNVDAGHDMLMDM